jgi:hypothetical protein
MENKQLRREKIKKDVKRDIKNFFIKTIAGLAFIAFSIFYAQKVIEKMGEGLTENAKYVQEKAQADLITAQREAKEKEVFSSENLAKLKAQRQTEAETQMDKGRKLQLERFKKEVAENQAEENKKTEFEKQFKPRAECEDPNLEWSKFVKCKNEKITAREEFYRTH